MYWLTENAFHPMMIGLLTAFVSWAFWFMTKKRVLLTVMIISLIATISVVVIEQVIVTDSEQLTANVLAAGAAVANNNKPALLEHVSPNAQSLIDEINHEMDRIRFNSVRVFGFATPVIDNDSDPPMATMEFNARVDADATESRWGVKGRGVSRVTLKFEKDAEGRWKILSYSNDRIQVNDFM